MRSGAATGNGVEVCFLEQPLAPTTGRRPKAAQVPGRARHKRQRRTPAARCVGCETQGRPGRSGRPSVLHQGSGERHRRERLVGAAAAFERAGAPRVLREDVRSTATEAPAVVSALVRARVHGAVRSPVDGEADTGDARSAAATSRGEARSRRSRRRASEARTATSAARSAVARRTRRCRGRCGRTKHRACRSGNGGERSEPPGKRSAQ